ncbi:hypothetical protein HHL19_20580 [Streptomyces sp. R302]|uniref:hypothetical protein n=1 Tax=unclassified Streptomyces TaxID=2593676 RepID=UPI00145FB955|nr:MULTISPECIES: hypothetical protein [unclassified Streptomyces]NML50904.1 hypothetical protein [Streptomyces sp. R301]NML80998.1 hypothetical protein [Streptomyces sp. R302]
MIHKSPVRRAALVAAALAALAVSCGATPESDAAAEDLARPTTTAATSAAPEATEAAEPTAAPDGPDALPDDATPATATPAYDPSAPASGEKVRDAFATLQATLNDSCATDCSYFLGRVHKELQELDMAMKADPKGPGHFPEPIARMAELNETLAGDASYPNLKKHQKELIGTRDFINTWMQDHPDDYR